MFKKLFNIKVKFFANKHLPRFIKCKPSWCKSMLEMFPLSTKTIPFFLHIYNFFINLFNNSVWEYFVKSNFRNKKIHK